MRKLLRKLRRYTLIGIPLIGNLFTTEYPECDGIIRYDNDRYAFCGVYQRYSSEDSLKFTFYGSVYYYIDLPGKVIDYDLHQGSPVILFDDGSAMQITSVYIGDTFNNFVLRNEAVKQYDNESLTDYLEEWMLRQHMDNLIIQCDPDDWIEPYASHYRIDAYRKKLLEDIKSEDYDRLNFEVSFPAMVINCFNVPASSFQKFIKSIGSLQILNKKYYDDSMDHKIIHLNRL